MNRAPQRNFFIYRTEYGPVSIGAYKDNICRMVLGNQLLEGEKRPSAVTNKCANQLMEYFSGKRTVFDVPILLEGSDFQLKVWNRILQIPYAQTCTATDVAQLIGHPKASSAVGSAIRQNPLVILVPAHRVVTTSGRIEANDKNAQLRRAFLELERRYA
ncbi:methylated-DNA--[protein]-cysteine S-methyltransferase [Adlercreutzia sp. ZJ154]|uniref:methylated-DNA--[protein]-cysteine S-methyltransferase n=1 Tax=Adlercreutzia sp. ZJ154 TaxID=2709790 RepID=UPI0013ECC355|nr:methylated-DNA--[protein]-cysteine S-methyltransferase [Adlercreutzia sp. ZJ154]